MNTNLSVINYTDYSFQKFCADHFGINRGVYNVIDNWFYENGINTIVDRRLEIINFLEILSVDFQEEHPIQIRFRNRGLKYRLNKYWTRMKKFEIIF